MVGSDWWALGEEWAGASKKGFQDWAGLNEKEWDRGGQKGTSSLLALERQAGSVRGEACYHIIQNRWSMQGNSLVASTKQKQLERGRGKMEILKSLWVLRFEAMSRWGNCPGRSSECRGHFKAEEPMGAWGSFWGWMPWGSGWRVVPTEFEVINIVLAIATEVIKLSDGWSVN